MSQKITIPQWRNPYEVEINNQKYVYKAGEEVSVPDDVYAVIMLDIEAHEATEANAVPALTQPRWGKGADKTVTTKMEGTMTCRYDEFGLSTYMTQSEYDGMMKADDFHAVWTHMVWEYAEEIETEVESYLDIEISKEELLYSAEDRRVWFNGGHGYSYEADYDSVKFSFTYEKTEEVYERIPRIYYGLPVTLTKTYDVNNFGDCYKSNVDPRDIIDAVKNGILVVATFIGGDGVPFKHTAEVSVERGLKIQNHYWIEGCAFSA